MLAIDAMKVLVIEDDRDVRESLIQTLKDEHFIVDAVEDGQEGLFHAQEWRYDIILLDVMLPELNGWQILERLRREKIKTPVLMLTALDEMDDRIKGLNQGADDYLTKPFVERELLARMRALYRRAYGHGDDVIDLGRVAIDTGERTISLNGEEVNLTAAQYRIVVYLAARAGKVVSRKELAESVIGEDDASISNVLDVQIYNIRRKLGKDFVQSRRGHGYIVPKQ